LRDLCDDDHATTIAPPAIVEPITLATAIAELNDVLGALRAVLDRREVAGLVEPLLDRSDLGNVLKCSLVTLDRLKSAGKLPKPDLILGRSPRWRAESIRAFLAKGGRP
jgi:hypothetical protein